MLNDKRVVLTEKGKGFLRNLRLKEGLPKKFIKNYATIIKWENGKNKPTLTLFKDYLSSFNLNLKYFDKEKLLEEIIPSIRSLAVQKTTKIKKEKHLLLIKEYLKGQTLEQIGKKYNCTPSNVFYIFKRYDIDTAKHGSGEKYKFPESKYIKDLIKKEFKKEEILPLIASLIFTDGCLYKTKKGGYEISYYGTDKTLHKVFADLVWSYLSIRPSSYMIKCGNVLRTKYINKDFAKNLLKLSPTYKTKPTPNESWVDFLKDNKPTLNFMKNYDNIVINEVLRLAMCADGCIAVSHKENKIFFTLILACSHPTLVEEWYELFNRIEIKSKIVKGTGKSKIGGVKGIENCLFRFLDIGGFIDGVKVCVKRSPLYGTEKQKILRAAVKILKKHNRINTAPIKFEKFKELI